MPGTTSSPQLPQKAQPSPGLFAPKYLFTYLLQSGIDLIFPPRCVGCGRIDNLWCEDCQSQLEETIYPQQVRPLPPFRGILSTAVHEGIIREAVQGLKYGNAPKMAAALGQRLIRQLTGQAWKIDMIVPVPLHTSRLAERGYNQAQLLAEYVAQEMQLPCLPAAISRQRNTQSQVTLSAAERQTNLKDAFRAETQFITGQSVLIIDDVYTTGATLSACADAVLQAGAQAVYGLTVTVARL
jgi:competence protein ComFC